MERSNIIAISIAFAVGMTAALPAFAYHYYTKNRLGQNCCHDTTSTIATQEGDCMGPNPAGCGSVVPGSRLGPGDTGIRVIFTAPSRNGL